PGVVIQLAQAAGHWHAPPPSPLPPALRSRPATLDHVAHAVADLDVGLRLFQQLLGGEPDRDGVAAFGPFVDLTWPGSGRIRLIERDAGLDGRAGRVHHLAFTVDDPADIPSARPLEDGRF